MNFTIKNLQILSSSKHIGKINIEFIYQIYPKFKSKYCMNEDFYCNAQLDQLLYEYLNEPE